MADTLIADAMAYAKAYFEGESSGHDWWHTWRVCTLATRLAGEIGADLRVCQLAALLHDVDDVKLSPETAANLTHARDFLAAHGCAEEETERVLRVIRQISFKGTDSVRPDTPEGQCVQDADRLDAIGAIGIARTFAFGGHAGRPIYDPETAPRLGMDEKAYRAASGCTLHHFDEKLLLLRDMMNTPAARRMAEHRHAVMEAYLEEFHREWNGEC